MESVDMAWVWAGFNMRYYLDGPGLDHTRAGPGLGSICAGPNTVRKKKRFFFFFFFI